MYLPPYHVETDVAVMQALIQAHPLGTWVTSGADGLAANHIPFILDRTCGTHGTLRAHVARANPIWRTLSGGANSLVIFQGPQSYITPSWYPGKQIDGKVVPTWNYTVVHTRGVANAIEDPVWIYQLITDLTRANESSNPQPWQVSDAPANFIEQMAKAIVGIEIALTGMEGKWKLSQDETLADRQGTIAGLAAQRNTNATDLARLVQERMA